MGMEAPFRLNDLEDGSVGDCPNGFPSEEKSLQIGPPAERKFMLQR